MKKSSFIAMVLGTASGMLFALGMCMALIPEWDMFQPGILFGCAGLLLGLITLLIWRKMEHKAPIRISGKTVCAGLLAVAGALMFGVGLCLSMVWGQMFLGIVLGFLGIGALLCLVPLIKGLKE
ncbi:hypothetical protein [Clostridium sp. D33t1_170424_F3]|uniref:hypothetical protein n=1 Tax=Clostridium sp. D33t1_170424_F3 TaxID=2787099 RepID=UPI0018AA2E05|nr:hypothetical protein [Clostridium sp. D33t1_170424_F3]